MNAAGGGGTDGISSLPMRGFIVLFLLAILVTIFVLHYVISRRTKFDIPFIRARWPVIGSALDLKDDPVEFMRHWSQKLGPVFGAMAFGTRIFFVVDPVAAAYLVSGRVPEVTWASSKARLASSAGVTHADSMKMSLKARQKHQLMEQFLIKDLGKLMIGYGNHLKMKVFPALFSEGNNKKNMSDSNDSHNSFGIFSFLGEAIWRASIHELYGFSNLENTNDYLRMLKFNEKIVTFIYTPQPFHRFYKEHVQARDDLAAKLATFKQENWQEGEWSTNFSYLIDQILREEQISDDGRTRLLVLSIFAATVLNTVPTAFWTLFHLLENKDAYNAVCQEVRSIWNKKLTNNNEPSPSNHNVSNNAFTLEELNKMVNLDSIITETLRLETTVAISRRRTAERDVTVKLPLASGETKTLHINKGEVVLTCPTISNRDEDVFENATSFQWNRFVPDCDGKPPSFYKHGKKLIRPVDAFGGGPTICPGRNFARAEIKIIIAMLLVEKDLSFAGGKVPPRPELYKDKVPMSSGRPAHDVYFEVHPLA